MLQPRADPSTSGHLSRSAHCSLSPRSLQDFTCRVEDLLDSWSLFFANSLSERPSILAAALFSFPWTTYSRFSEVFTASKFFTSLLSTLPGVEQLTGGVLRVQELQNSYRAKKRNNRLLFYFCNNRKIEKLRSWRCRL